MNHPNPGAGQIPLLDHALGEPTAFTPEALIQAVRSERGLPARPVPELCLLDFDGGITDWLVASHRAEPWISWACFYTPMVSIVVDGTAVAIIPRTIGGPYAVLVAEQLRASGAKVIFGLTSAGRVDPALPLPSFVIPTAALRDEGTSYHSFAPSPSADPTPELIEPLRAALKPLGRSVVAGPVRTTDAPYRETREQWQRHAVSGILAVDMQAASLFAFSAARNFPIGIVAQVTNAVHHHEDSFDKGSHDDEYRLVEAISRVGVRYLHERPRG